MARNRFPGRYNLDRATFYGSHERRRSQDGNIHFSIPIDICWAQFLQIGLREGLRSERGTDA
jgi:hypothetical protein